LAYIVANDWIWKYFLELREIRTDRHGDEEFENNFHSLFDLLNEANKGVFGSHLELMLNNGDVFRYNNKLRNRELGVYTQAQGLRMNGGYAEYLRIA
jgi:hypothetical protein